MEPSEYNGWENKFTWLVHLHLSSEVGLANEMTSLVAGAPMGYPVGRLVEQWVREALTKWQMNVPDRDRASDGSLRLLAWDGVSSVLAYADWDMLSRLLTGETVVDGNLFTWSLYRSILNDSHLHHPVSVLMQVAWRHMPMFVQMRSRSGLKRTSMPGLMPLGFVGNTMRQFRWSFTTSPRAPMRLSIGSMWQGRLEKSTNTSVFTVMVSGKQGTCFWLFVFYGGA